LNNKLLLDYQLSLDEKERSQYWVPEENTVRVWIGETLNKIAHANPSELTVRIVGIPEITELNITYRSKNSATNVLSFPFENVVELDVPLLGDIVICSEVVNNEAIEQGKSIESHWAHMVVHGCLHLCGFDHESYDQAKEMETIEIAVLNNLGYIDPYKDISLERGLENVEI